MCFPARRGSFPGVRWQTAGKEPLLAGKEGGQKKIDAFSESICFQIHPLYSVREVLHSLDSILVHSQFTWFSYIPHLSFSTH